MVVGTKGAAITVCVRGMLDVGSDTSTASWSVLMSPHLFFMMAGWLAGGRAISVMVVWSFNDCHSMIVTFS